MKMHFFRYQKIRLRPALSGKKQNKADTFRIRMIIYFHLIKIKHELRAEIFSVALEHHFIK